MTYSKRIIYLRRKYKIRIQQQMRFYILAVLPGPKLDRAAGRLLGMAQGIRWPNVSIDIYTEKLIRLSSPQQCEDYNINKFPITTFLEVLLLKHIDFFKRRKQINSDYVFLCFEH